MNSYDRVYSLLLEFQPSPEGEKHTPKKIQCPSCKAEGEDKPEYKSPQSEFVNKIVKGTEAGAAAQNVIDVLHMGKSTPKPKPYICPGCSPGILSHWKKIGFKVPDFGKGGKGK